MSTTNLSSHCKGSGQWMTKAVDGSLQGVGVEIHGTGAKTWSSQGKTQAYYQEWLGDLCHAWEAMQQELVGLREEGDIQSPSTIDLPTSHP